MKDIYELLNHAEIELSEFDETALNDIDKKKLKKRVHKDIKSGRRIFVKAIKVGAVALSVIAVTAFASYKVDPTFATGIPVVGNVIKNITGYGDEEFDKYISIINKTVENKGIKVTLKEIMLDDNQLRIAIMVKSDVKATKGYWYEEMTPDIFIDGEILRFNTSRVFSEQIDDNTFVLVSNIEVHNIKIPSRMNMKIIYNNFNFSAGNGKDKVVKEKWEFETNISKEEIKSKTQEIKVNKKITGKYARMNIEDIKSTPLTTNVNFKLWGGKPLGLIIKDDKGRVLTQEGLGCRSDGLFGYIGNYQKGNINLSAVSKDAKKLTITPFNDYRYPLSKEYAHIKPVKWTGNLPIILKQNDENKIIVHKIEKKDGKLYVYYKTEGISYDIQRYKLYLYDSCKKSLDCLYDEGNLSKLKNKNEMIIGVFKANDKGDIYLGTDNMKDIEVIKDEELSVDLDEN